MLASVPPTAVRALLLRGDGAAAGGRVVLLQGAATGRARALLLGAAASGRVTLVAVGRAAPLRPRCTAGAGNHASDDDDEKAKLFGDEIQEMCLGVVVHGDDELLGRLATTAKEAEALLAAMIKDAPAPLSYHVRQELVLVSAAFTEVEGHCELGYVTDTSVVTATSAVKKMTEVFLGSGAAEDLGPYPRVARAFYVGGAASEDSNTNTAYLRQLATVFCMLLGDVKDAYDVRRPGGGD